METEYLDEDGYPTEAVLDIIKNWQHEKGWTELLAFVRELWAYTEFWREEKNVTTIDLKNYKVVADVYHVSTAGWSGNESIIMALQENWMFWTFCWEQSNRGGHYIFHVKNNELSFNNTLSENTQKMLGKLKNGET